jgi:hypothetical protein
MGAPLSSPPDKLRPSRRPEPKTSFSLIAPAPSLIAPASAPPAALAPAPSASPTALDPAPSAAAASQASSEPAPGAVEPAAPAASAQGPASTSTEPPPKPHFPLPAELPTQAGPNGLRFDFNFGARVVVPDGRGSWRIRLSDLDTGNVLYETTVQKGWVSSAKRYYIRVRIEAFAGDSLLFTYDYDCRDKEVLVQLPVGTLGDSIGWFPYAAKFQRAHGCRLSVAMAETLIPLFRDAYPEITFLTHEQVDAKRYCAT